jgi:2-polyprenyl-6-methoxyphenol hydroxylase-like FAD-dependent oxidoreductase
MKGCNVAVIGGGPAGVLTAAHFAKRGAHVTVYERRTAQQQSDPVRGWSIALGDVATDSITAAGLSADFGPEGRFVPRTFSSMRDSNFGCARCCQL